MSSTVQVFYNSGIATFRIGDNKLTNCADARYMFYNSGILSFGSEANPISFGSTGSNVILQYFGMNASSFTDFFVTDSNRINSFSEAFRGSGIVNFGSETTPVGIGSIADNSSTCDCNTSFYLASSLKEVHFDYGERISGLQNAFTGTGITTFRIGDNKLTNCNGIYNAFYQVTTFGPEFGTEANPITFGSSGSNLNFQGVFYGATSLTDFFITDSARITSFSQTFQGSGLVNFGSSTTPVGIGSIADNSSTCTFNSILYASSSLKEVHIDSGERITDMTNAFYNTGITTFRVGDNKLTNVTIFNNAFRNTSISEFGTEANPITFGNSGSAPSLSNAFRTSSSSGTKFFIIDSARITSFNNVFESSGIVNLGSSTTPIGIGSTADNSTLCTFYQTCNGSTSLKEAYLDSGERLSNMQYAFNNCTGITTFRINDTNLNNVTTMQYAFQDCALDTASIENILVSCDNGGKSSIQLHIDGGTNAAKTTWTSAANTAYTNLIGKSWTISYNA